MDLMQRMEEKHEEYGGNTPIQEYKKYKTLFDKHEFWDTQPVTKCGFKKVDKEGEIEKGKVDEVRKEPYNLPTGYSWSDIDLENEEQLNEVYELLRDHYVEDSDHMFRFDYQKEFLKWAILPPKQNPDWILGVRGGKNNKLFGFITGIPINLRLKKKIVKMTEINFLCVHTKLRKARLAPVLIKEITRRTHLKNMWQALYTAGIIIPTPISECTYYYRDLNPKKLLEIGFSFLPHGRPKSLHIKLLSLPKEPEILGIRPMEKKDVKKVWSMLTEYLKKFDVSLNYSKDEVAHFLLPRKNVIYSYVVVDSETKEITDFISYYSLPSTIINGVKYKTLFAAFCYYIVPGKYTINELFKNALILAKNDKFDVFNALNIMENKQVFDGLHFGVGSGHLYYYLYNWNINRVEPEKMGVVLV